MNSSKRLGVLIVDDNEMTRAVLRITLQGEEYEVIGEAATGGAGLDAAMRLRPDIVCLDIVMPDMNGLDVLRALRDALPRTAVLMVTASADLGTVRSAIASGAAGFIVKPFNAVTVHDTMRKTALAVLRQRAQGKSA